VHHSDDPSHSTGPPETDIVNITFSADFEGETYTSAEQTSIATTIVPDDSDTPLTIVPEAVNEMFMRKKGKKGDKKSKGNKKGSKAKKNKKSKKRKEAKKSKLANANQSQAIRTVGDAIFVTTICFVAAVVAVMALMAAWRAPRPRTSESAYLLSEPSEMRFAYGREANALQA